MSLSKIFFENNKDYFSNPLSLKKLINPPQNLINHSLLFSNSRNKETVIKNCSIGYNSEVIISVFSNNSIILNPNIITDNKFTYCWDLLDLKTGLRIEVKTYSTNIDFIDIGAKSIDKFPILSPKNGIEFYPHCNIENALLHKYADLILFVHHTVINDIHIFTPTLLIEPIYSMISKMAKQTKYKKVNKMSRTRYLDLNDLLYSSKYQEYNEFFMVIPR